MSFRRRSDVIAGTPVGTPRRGPAPGARLGQPPSRAAATADRAQDAILGHPGVRPSLLTSAPTVSTGSLDLDKILLHQGLPLGTSLLVEEAGTTDFATILLRVFASQGIVHNRLDRNQPNTHVVVVGQPNMWAKDLPAMYKGSLKEQRKAIIAENQAKVSVANLNATGSRTENEMKIAWRYGLRKQAPEEQERHGEDHYSHAFDITLRLVPTPAMPEITFVALSRESETPITLLHHIEDVVSRQAKQGKVVRLVVPNLLNPLVYPPYYAEASVVIPLVHSLRAMLRRYPQNLVMMASISLDLFARDTHLTYTLELLVDGVIQLQPFNQEMSEMIEKAYKNEPHKIQHGLVHIHKLPVLSERGLMMVHDGEYAFRNGKKKFQIEEWGIPVEDDAKDEQTSQNIDF